MFFSIGVILSGQNKMCVITVGDYSFFLIWFYHYVNFLIIDQPWKSHDSWCTVENLVICISIMSESSTISDQCKWNLLLMNEFSLKIIITNKMICFYLQMGIFILNINWHFYIIWMLNHLKSRIRWKKSGKIVYV